MPIELVNKPQPQPTPTNTETLEPTTPAAVTPAPIEANGPATDVSRIRRTIADLLSPVSRLFENQNSSDLHREASGANAPTESFLSKCRQFYDRMARGFWGLVENVTEFAKWLYERVEALKEGRVLYSAPTEPRTPHDTNHPNTPQNNQETQGPRREEKILFEEHKKKPEDVLCAAVGEAVRREHERQKDLAVQEQLREKHIREQTVDQVHEIDRRNGTTNENAEIIINNMLSGWTSVSAAISQILAAQDSEVVATKKKIS